ncbi:MAG: cation:proton antiporter [Gemmatimonadota bacterium]
MAGDLLGLATLLLALAGAGTLLKRIGLSAIPAYILLGMAAATLHPPAGVVRFMEAIGIALLLFFVGLEFSILRLRREARRLAAAGGMDLAVNFPVGLVGGLLLGWELPAAFLLGAALYISSSAIVARNITLLRRAAFPETEVALGVLVVEDLIIAMILAGIALWASVPGQPHSPLMTGTGIIGLVLILTVLARPLSGLLDRLGMALDDESLLLSISGVLLVFSGVALAVGLSEAIGAFAAGLLVGDTRLVKRVEGLLSPFQDLFAVLFFFAFGLTIDIRQLGAVWLPALALAAFALLSKLIGGHLIGRSVGLPLASRVSLGFTLTPRGEFSLIVAAYGAAIGYHDLAPLVAMVVMLLAIAGTQLTQAGPRIGQLLAQRLARAETEV